MYPTKRILLAGTLTVGLISSLFPQFSSLSGTITNEENGQGLAGVNIVLESNGHGTISGIHGEYTLKDVPVGEQKLLFSFIGYETHREQVIFDTGKGEVKDVALRPGSVDLSSVTVEARRSFSAASSVSVRDFDLKVKPVASAQQVLQLVPGLFIAQHAGGGKAEQIFLRGFDSDHGTDVGIYVDGLPVNMVTHGHGQGYADLHFLIPELIDRLEVYKGPYFSEFGNFGTAGSIRLTTTDHPDNNLVKMEGGMFRTAKTTAILKIPTDSKHQSAYMAGQYYRSNGPLENPQGFNRANLFAKFHTHLTEKSELGVSMSAFSSGWKASGQIPQRAVDQGLISRWGAIDNLEGGNTSRYNVSLDYHFMDGYEHDFMIQAYATLYDFRLYSNFTFWLNDPENGDMIEQNDHRQLYGLNGRYRYYKRIGKVRTYTRAGFAFRGDQVDLSLWKSPSRMRMYPFTNHGVIESNSSVWLEEDIVFNRFIKLQLGLRGDYFTFDVDDHLEFDGSADLGLIRASGTEQAATLSPKLNLVLSPLRWMDLYLNSGTGFHSNDARDVLIAQRTRADIKTLPRALGAEVGMRLGGGSRILLGLAGWMLHLEEELVFIGDEGGTEISGESMRLGMDAELRLQVAKWLWADLDLNLSNGRYVEAPEGADHIPLAPRFTSQGGLNAMHPSGFEGSLRYRYIGDRPANENASVIAEGYFIADLVLAYRFKGIRFFVQLENLLDTQWNEAQFDTESRLYNESLPVSEIHFTPGNPFNIQAGISLEF